MGQNIDDKDLIKETYAVGLQLDRLTAFEDFWEAYIDQRLEGEQPQFIEDQFLQSHFSMALGIVERIRHEKEEENYFHRLIMSHPGLAFIMDHEGHIIAANPDASDVLDGQSVLNALPIDQKSYSDIMSWINNLSSRNLSPTNQSGKKSYAFKDVIWGNDERASFMLAEIDPPKYEIDIQNKSSRYVLISRIDLQVTEAVLPTIQDRYNLTPAEASVAMHLANGHSVKNISKLRSTSEQTVRTQIKQVLSKTQSRDIAQLVVLMLSLGGKFQSVTSQTTRFQHAETEQGLMRIYNVILPDGRYLEYIEQGHPNGRPVLVVHGIVKGIKLTTRASRKAVLNNWRFIIPIRAGFGNSDPNIKDAPEKTVAAAIEDLKFLLDYLKLDKVCLMNDWAGAYANRLARKYPERVKGILQMTAVPMWAKGYQNYFNTRHRVIVKTSLYAPMAAPYMLRLAKALIDSGRGHVFVQDVDKDLDTKYSIENNDKDILSVMVHGFENLFRQGVQPFLQDLKVLHKDWADDYTRLNVPVSVLYGDGNSLPQSVFDAYVSKVPNAKLRIIPNAGLYLRFNYFDCVLEELEHLL